MNLQLAIAFTLTVGLGAAGSRPAAEYDIKAAFLVNFASYVEWPEGSFQNPEEPIVVCVLGSDPFGRALDDVAAGKTILGHAVTARRLPDARSAAGCRVLFVHSLDRKQASSLSRSVPEPGVLLVGETDGPAPDSMIVTFAVENGRVRFSVNLKAAERQKLRLSSRLLGLASNVQKE